MAPSPTRHHPTPYCGATSPRVPSIRGGTWSMSRSDTFEGNHKKFMIWTERDGTRTAIPQLKLTHLMLIIAKIETSQADMKEGERQWRSRYLPFLKEEFNYRLSQLDSNRNAT